MKRACALELVRQGYWVYPEPLWPPCRRLWWASYRPDLLGVRSSSSRQDYAFVECETNPSTRRLLAKNYLSVELQDQLDVPCSLRRVLAIPRGTLHRLEASLRYSWETWIFGNGLLKIPLAGRS